MGGKRTLLRNLVGYHVERRLVGGDCSSEERTFGTSSTFQGESSVGHGGVGSILFLTMYLPNTRREEESREREGKDWQRFAACQAVVWQWLQLWWTLSHEIESWYWLGTLERGEKV